MIKIIKDLVNKDQKVFIAVSMGVDSLAAFHWMLSRGYKITGLHFNHKMRKQNDEMESKFLEFCRKFNIESYCGYGKDLQTEKECRQARIDFYSTKIKRETLITAHHLNDWIESYLLNCFRGKANHDPIPLISNFPEFVLKHPFILTRKKDFCQYIERNNLEQYLVEDDTNKKIKGSRRNWIRQIIIPEMNNQQFSLEKFAEKKIKTQINCFAN